MRALHLFFQLHRPYEIKTPENFDQGYFGGEAEFRELERTEYQPFFALIERNTQRHAGLKISLAVSGSWLEQAEKWSPALVRRLRKLVESGRVEILAQPHYHSLAAFYDKAEFAAQVELFQKKVASSLGAKCQSLCLPELIYHDKIGKWADEQGFQALLAGDADQILDWRSANYIYEVPGCEKVRVLFQNSALSRAVRLGRHEVMTEGVRQKVEPVVGGTIDDETKPVSKTKLTAAEFVRGMSGTSRPKSTKFTVGQTETAFEADGVWTFSAKKLQKQLEIACLRGNLINLCLDTGIFRDYREQGVVGMFDEFFASWLKVPGNKFVTISEAAALQEPRAIVGVKTTVNWRGEAKQCHEAGLVSAKDVRYCPPNWLRNPEQVQMQRELYGLRMAVLSSGDEALALDFGKLTAMDYLLLYDSKINAPAVVASQISALEITTLDNLKAALADFRERVPILKLPEHTEDGLGGSGSELAEEGAKLTAQRLGKQPDVDKSELQDPEEEDHSVVVHRVKRTVQPEEPETEDTAEIGSGLDDMGESDTEEYVDPDELEMDEWQEAVSDAADDAEAELQIMMQRMSRAKSIGVEMEIEELAEAEVVIPEVATEKSQTKKRKKKRIVLE